MRKMAISLNTNTQNSALPANNNLGVPAGSAAPNLTTASSSNNFGPAVIISLSSQALNPNSVPSDGGTVVVTGPRKQTVDEKGDTDGWGPEVAEEPVGEPDEGGLNEPGENSGEGVVVDKSAKNGPSTAEKIEKGEAVVTGPRPQRFDRFGEPIEIAEEPIVQLTQNQSRQRPSYRYVAGGREHWVYNKTDMLNNVRNFKAVARGMVIGGSDAIATNMSGQIAMKGLLNSPWGKAVIAGSILLLPALEAYEDWIEMQPDDTMFDFDVGADMSDPSNWPTPEDMMLYD